MTSKVHKLLLLLLFHTVCCDEHSHTYEVNEEVVLWMNTVGPYHNRQETYGYFSLPFCAGPKESISHYHETLGEALQGTELEFSGLQIEFRADIARTEFCQVQLNEEKQKAFLYAVKNHYWYQMYLDDLPIWGIVGEIDEKDHVSYYIWTHKKFEIGYNDNQIVDVNLTSENRAKIQEGEKIKFTYEVVWKKSNINFEDRFDKYLDPNFFQHRIHWFSIFNSFMMVIFLVGLVTMILMRTLRKDYARYSKEDDMDDMERDLGDEYGWKQVHGDVFRPAANPMLFSALIGAGSQIAVVVLFVILFAILGELYTERGSLLSTAIFVYAATAPVNGYFGGSLYARMGGKIWIKQMLLSASLMPLLVCGTAFFINFIAMYYHASRAIPFGTMVAVTCICLFVILPLTLVGTVLGRNLAGSPDYPCRINAVPRPIPEKKMVHGAVSDHCSRGYFAIWVNIHRDVFHLHVILGLQNILRLRIHASSISDPPYCDRLCDNCVYLLPPKCRRLPLAVDIISLSRLHRRIRLLLLLLLLFLQNKDVRTFSDHILLWLYGSVLAGAGSDVWYSGICRDGSLCQEDLWNSEN